MNNDPAAALALRRSAAAGSGFQCISVRGNVIRKPSVRESFSSFESEAGRVNHFSLKGRTMSKNVTNSLQAEFIKLYRDETLTVAEILKRLGIKQQRFGRWLKSKSFKSKLEPISSDFRAVRVLARDRLKTVALDKFSESIQQGKSEPAKPETIRTTAQDEPRADRKTKDEIVGEKPRCRRHPGVSEEESRKLTAQIHLARG